MNTARADRKTRMQACRGVPKAGPSRCEIAKVKSIRHTILTGVFGLLVGTAVTATEQDGPPAEREPQLTSEQQKRLDLADQLDQRVCGLFNAGRFRQALPLAEEALAIRREIQGLESPATAASMANLAMQHASIEDYAKAEPLAKHALEIRRKVLGERHPDYLSSLDNLAWVYFRRGESAKALPLCQEALAIQGKLFGDQTPDYA